MAKDILQEQKSNPLIPRHTLQDEELVVLLKALDSFKANICSLDCYTLEDYKIAGEIAKNLRKKAGWEAYSKSQDEIKKIPSHLQQACEECDD